MEFVFYTPNDLSVEEEEYLLSQEINLDDWGHMVFVESFHDFKINPVCYPEITMKNYSVTRLLNESSRNTWYLIQNFKGKNGVLGIAYHS
jgi:hypothetical protein